MQGAVSNQIVKCIIFSNNKDKAVAKLNEIKEEKIAQDIQVTYSVLSKIYNEIRFSDGEEWIVLSANDSVRGYRWRKAWVDKDVPQYTIDTYINPIGDLYKWEDYKVF